MPRALVCVLLLAGAACAAPEPVKIACPDGRIALSIQAPDSGPNTGWLTYGIFVRGKPLVAPSRLGLKLEGHAALGEKLTSFEAVTASGTDSYRLFHGKASRVQHPWRAATVRTESPGGPSSSKSGFTTTAPPSATACPRLWAASRWNAS